MSAQERAPEIPGVWKAVALTVAILIGGALTSFGIAAASSYLGGFFERAWDGYLESLDADALYVTTFDALWLSLYCAVTVTATWFAARWVSGHRQIDYLALRWPQIRQIGRWALIACLALIPMALAQLFLVDYHQVDGYSAIQIPVWVYLIAIEIFGNITSIGLFLGFLFPSLKETQLGPHGAIWLLGAFTFILFAFDSFFLAILWTSLQLLVGYARWQSGSTLLAISIGIFLSIGLACVDLAKYGTLYF